MQDGQATASNLAVLHTQHFSSAATHRVELDRQQCAEREIGAIR
jgi:hypothetical protein